MARLSFPPGTVRRAPPPPLLGSLLAAAACFWAALVGAEKPVRVQAQVAFSALARSRTASGLEVRGRLLDDAERPLADAPLQLRVPRLRRLPVVSCGSERSLARRGNTQSEYSFRTDADGSFCVKLLGPLGTAASRLTLAYPGDLFHLPASAAVPALLVRSTLSLAFESPALEFPLDRAEHRVSVSVSATPPPPSGEAIALELRLESLDRTAIVGEATWLPGADSVEFKLSSDSLGEPGAGRLRVRHPGSALAAPAEADAVAFRIAPVHLSAHVAGLDGHQATLLVGVGSIGSTSPPGWVEARANGERFGAAPISEHAATLSLDFANSSEIPERVQLHYLGEDPCWVAGAPLELELAPKATGTPLRWPWLALLLPIAYLFFRALQRPGVSAVPVSPAESAAAAIEVIEPRRGLSGWVGVVRDAHELTPITGARISVSSTALGGQPLGPSTASDEQGRFELGAANFPAGAQITISSPGHSELSRPLPPQGRVVIALVSRRRTIARRLVEWARAAGAPWVGSREPTPGEVLHVALRRSDSMVAEWARGVEAATFGDRDPDQQREAYLREQEPTWGTQSDRKR